jgi:hypothetical protein
VADPLVEAVEDVGRIRELEVPLPASEVTPQLHDHDRNGPATVPCSHLPDALLHRFKSLGRDAPLHHSSRSHPEAVAEEFSVLRSRHRTLHLVDAQPESSVQTPKRRHHVLARPSQPNIHVAIVGVAHEGVTALLRGWRPPFPAGVASSSRARSLQRHSPPSPVLWTRPTPRRPEGLGSRPYAFSCGCYPHRSRSPPPWVASDLQLNCLLFSLGDREAIGQQITESV